MCPVSIESTLLLFLLIYNFLDKTYFIQTLFAVFTLRRINHTFTNLKTLKTFSPIKDALFFRPISIWENNVNIKFRHLTVKTAFSKTFDVIFNEARGINRTIIWLV